MATDIYVLEFSKFQSVRITSELHIRIYVRTVHTYIGRHSSVLSTMRRPHISPHKPPLFTCEHPSIRETTTAGSMSWLQRVSITFLPQSIPTPFTNSVFPLSTGPDTSLPQHCAKDCSTTMRQFSARGVKKGYAWQPRNS